MTHLFEIRIYERHRVVFEGEFGGLLELGRQKNPDEKLLVPVEQAGRSRMAIARLDEQGVSRGHVLLEPVSERRIKVTNQSDRRSVYIDGVCDLGPKSPPRDVPVPLTFTLGNKTVRVQEPENAVVNSLDRAARPPAPVSQASSNFATLAAPHGLDVETVRALRVVLEILQSAATSTDFFQIAAQGVVDLVRLDLGRVLLFAHGEWTTASCRHSDAADADASPPPSRRILGLLCKDKKTIWQMRGALAQADASLTGVQAVVAAPILDAHGNVIGALYGDRGRQTSARSGGPITGLEAELVELLASGVAAGLSRLEQERAALAANVLLEQFFTPQLARQLATRPELLEGRDADVTILFCDIRGFSRLSERLDGDVTVQWVSDVMEVLSACIQDQQGVLVDYIGDEVMAMWGAPEQTADHARLACQAAQAMLRQLPTLNARWQSVLGEPMDVGIGINTGTARVGNVGSKRKLKYGPLGNTVNLASRVQGVTKHLKARLIVTRATHDRIQSDLGARRLCAARLVNIQEPVELYELQTDLHENWHVLKQDYEKALDHFERREFRQAARILGNMQGENANDGPSLVLLSRAVSHLVQTPEPFDPVWPVPSK